MDELSDLWKYQQGFAAKMLSFFSKKKLEDLDFQEKVSETKDYILSLQGECKEVLDVLPWKRHRIEEKKFNRRALLEELIDIQKFLWGLMYIWGITEDEFKAAFTEKSAVVEHRFSQEFGGIKTILETSKQVAIIDIDGVLTNYPQHFLDWVEEKTGDSQLDRNTSPILWEEMKHDYRISGAKKDLPVRKGADFLLQKLRDRGCFLVIATNRPVVKYPNLVSDTLFWLKNNNLIFDYLYFADLEEKLIGLASSLKKISIVIDDSEEICNRFKTQGIRTIHVLPEDNLEELSI